MSLARTIAEHALAFALGYAEAHTHEEGGNNRGDQVEFFLRLVGAPPGAPWCAAFVSTCRVKASASLSDVALDRPTLLDYAPYVPLVTGYCPTLWAEAKKMGLTHPKTFTGLRLGDLVLYDFIGQGEPHHIGFVRGLDAHGNLSTVEGNTSGPSGSQADGDGVFLKVRPLTYVYGFIHFE